MLSDPIADMLTRIRNAQMVAKPDVVMPASKFKLALANLLKNEGYIEDATIVGSKEKPELSITLKYYAGRPVIEKIVRVSRPGLRVYKEKSAIPQTVNGLGITVVSTSKGIMTDRGARREGLGGEVICYVA